MNGGKQKTVIKAPPTDSEGGLLKVHTNTHTHTHYLDFCILRPFL